MKSILTLVFITFLLVDGEAQIKAVTESGDQVILYDDQTWAYEDQEELEEEEILLNETVFNTPENSSFQVKSAKISSGILIDPKRWSFKKAVANAAAEYEFNLKDKEVYAIWIAEEITIPLETLGRIAISNARAASTNLVVLNKEYRMVNGRKILHIEMSAKVQGMDFVYYGYYYSDDSGSSQVFTYTFAKMMEEYKPDMEAFLNGFSAKEE